MNTLVSPMANTQTIRRGLSSTSLSREQLVFLAKLPSLLNSSFETNRIIHIALEHVQAMLGVETAALYLHDRDAGQLRYWARSADGGERVERAIPFDSESVVGSVVENAFPLVVEDGSKSNFSLVTRPECEEQEIRSLVCTPLMGKGKVCFGAIEMVNRASGEPLNSEDVVFIEQFGHQVALALDNARLYQESEARNEMLERLDRRKSEMISIIAHEFLTPITLIKGSSEIVAMKCGQSGENLEILGMLTKGVERLQKLIEQVKSVAMLQEGSIPVSRSSVDLAGQLRELETQYRSVATERAVALSIELDETVQQIEADADLLRLAMESLLSNAFRSTPDGGEITIGVSQETETICLSVRDTGIGIDKDELPYIFEKFYEVGDVNNHSSGDYNFGAKGLGLGLVAVRHIAEAHGGWVEVESEQNNGSEFRLHLPRQR